MNTYFSRALFVTVLATILSASPAWANGSPTVTPVPDAETDVGSPIQFYVQATDPEGDDLTYALVQFSPAPPSGYAYASVDGASGLFRWRPRQGDAGIYVVEVRVNDGMSAPVMTSFQITVNEIPRIVMPAFIENIPSLPSGSGVGRESNANDIALSERSYVVGLKVAQGDDRMTLAVGGFEVENRAPSVDLIANLAEDPPTTGLHDVHVGDTLTLGIEASDPDGDTLALRLIPNDIPGTRLDGAAGILTWTPTPDQVGVQDDLRVAVDDGKNMSSSVAPVFVNVINDPPVADAGSDILVYREDTFQLSGLESTDPNGDTLYYEWSVPEDFEIDSPWSAEPTLTAPYVTAVEMSYDINLTVYDRNPHESEYDDVRQSDSDTITVTVTSVPRLQVILVLDKSGSMGGAPIASLKSAAEEFVCRLNPHAAEDDQDWAGLVWFSAPGATIDLDTEPSPAPAVALHELGVAPDPKRQVLYDSINAAVADGFTPLFDGVNLALQWFMSPQNTVDSPPDFEFYRVMIVLADGQDNISTLDLDQDIIPSLNAYRGAGNPFLIFTIGYNVAPSSNEETTLKKLAYGGSETSTPDSYGEYFSATTDAINQIFQEIANRVGVDLTGVSGCGGSALMSGSPPGAYQTDAYSCPSESAMAGLIYNEILTKAEIDNLSQQVEPAALCALSEQEIMGILYPLESTRSEENAPSTETRSFSL